MTEHEHLDLDTLADHAEGLLSESAAAAVRTDLETCLDCRARERQVADVSRVLAEAPAPRLPEALAERMDEALADEARERKVVPIQRPRHASTKHARRPRRLAAAAASIAVLGVATVVGVQTFQGGETTTTALQHAPQADGNAAGEGSAASRSTMRSVDPARAAASVTASGRDYSSTQLPRQVSQLIRQKHAESGSGVSVQAAKPTPNRLQSLASPTTLAKCVSRVAGSASQDLVAVDLASYLGKPAAVIVAKDRRPPRTDVWIVNPSCSKVRVHTQVQKGQR